MTDKTEYSGRCLCGATTFKATGVPSAAHACHCDDCQRFTGGAFIGVDFPDLVVSGPVNWFQSSDWGERGSCSSCGSAMFWRLRAGGLSVVAIGSLDEADQIAPIDKHYFADNVPSAYNFSGDAARLSRTETLAFFESMSQN